MVLGQVLHVQLVALGQAPLAQLVVLDQIHLDPFMVVVVAILYLMELLVHLACLVLQMEPQGQMVALVIT